MKHSKIEALAFGFLLALTAGCGSPDVNNSDSEAGEAEAGEGESGATSMDESGDTTTSSTGGGECESTHSPNDSGAADGETCTEDADCTSNFCFSFADAPVDANAVCAPVDFGCSTRAAGTVRDFVTRMPIEGLTIKVSGAIAASVNPNNAPVLAEGTTNAMGQFDITSDERIEQPLGIVGIVSGDGFHLSATGLQSPSDANFFPPGTGIHDVWTLSTTTLGEWNTALESDTDLADFVPLGEKGGVVGMVRDGTTGEPAPGHTVVTSGDSTNAQVRYLNDAGTAFDAAATGTSGIFILVNPGLGEDFEAQFEGTTVDGADGTAGSTAGSLFVLVLDV